MRKGMKSCGLTIKMKPLQVYFFIGFFIVKYLQNEVCDWGTQEIFVHNFL